MTIYARAATRSLRSIIGKSLHPNVHQPPKKLQQTDKHGDSVHTNCYRGVQYVSRRMIEEHGVMGRWEERDSRENDTNDVVSFHSQGNVA